MSSHHNVYLKNHMYSLNVYNFYVSIISQSRKYKRKMIKKFHAYYKSYQAKDAIKEGNMQPAGFNYKKRSDTYIDR